MRLDLQIIVWQVQTEEEELLVAVEFNEVTLW